MNTVIVTGARGFIGRALSARLEREGVRVLRVTRGEPLPKAPEACCVHLADINDAARAAADEQGARRQSEELAKRILAAGYARVVFASTAYVYETASSPRHEDSPTAPASAYARIKLALESSFSESGGVIARLSNVYGPDQSSKNAISDILKQIPGDGIVRLRGSSESVRDYLFIDDAAEGLARLALSKVEGVFNLSTGQGTSIADLIGLLARLHGLPRPRIESTSTSAPSTLVLDPERAAARLGWKARTPLQQGLKSLLLTTRPS